MYYESEAFFVFFYVGLFWVSCSEDQNVGFDEVNGHNITRNGFYDPKKTDNM